ncbi:hypothetical protein QR680_001659 [Steinernema hermaphroditum]|uniref:Unconventional myosin-XV n=1 Tax=Steinernema hermaphroditum TaxID=289476 RepID=A0AA39GZ89_9BILA|nr:hypothetical protein QR680_001659 [Steinernema hermaphroditum]
MSFVKNDLVWMDSGVGYATPAVVVETNPLVVYNELTNCNFPIKNSTRLTLRDQSDNMSENLCNISDGKPESLLHTLFTRFQNNRYYSYNGPVVISINPNENLNIYDKSVMKQYKTKPLEQLPCHPFAVAETACNNIKNGSQQEYVLFSGESGSGKSTNAFHVMKYLSYMSSQIDIEIVESVHCILAAFSRAKTQKTESATRTGLCVDFLYGRGEGAQGLRVRQALPLDLFRLVEQKLGERNYNIFYQMCAGMSQKQKTKYGIKAANKFFYLNQGKCGINDDDETEKFNSVQKAFGHLKFTDDQQEMIFALLSAILHIGNLFFVSLKCTGGEEVADVGNEAELKWVALLLDLTMEQCKNMFLKKKDRVTNQPVSITVEQALDIRDAVSQTIYEKLFAWLLAQISKRFETDDSKTITVLDSYGFERFNKNGFEELCINSVNERLESVYINRLFKADLSLFESEGISAGYSLSPQYDNIEVLTCLAKKPTGIIPLLSNECKFPKSSDATFLQSCNVNQLDKTCYSKARSKERLEFGLTHYAGTTWYNLDGFIKKNQRVMSPLALQSLSLSQNTSIASMFGQDQQTTHEKTIYVAEQFYESAAELAKILVKHNCQFVQCLRSNNHSLIGKFDHQTVARQFNALLVAETSKSVKESFPQKMTMSEFAKRYRCILPFDAVQNVKEGALVRDILDAQGIKFSKDFEIGRNLVFLRQKMFDHLESARNSIVNRAAIVIQANVRAYVGNLLFQRKKKAVTVLQAGFRGWQTRKTIEGVKQQHLQEIQKEAPPQSGIAAFPSVERIAKPICEERRDKGWSTKVMGTYIPLALAPKMPNIDPETIEDFAADNFKNHILESRREPIFTPFLVKESDESVEKSLKIFKLILKYTLSGDLSPIELHHIATQIMQVGIDDQNQRDEIYVQLCNQSYKCRDKSVFNKTWKLMLMAVNSFPPSIHILPMLLDYFQSQSKPLSTLLLAGLLNRVRNVHINPNRKYAPTMLEDTAFTKHLPPVVTVKFSDEVTINIEVDSWETVGDLAKRALKERGICDQEGWSISIQNDKRRLYAETDCFLFDAIKHLEGNYDNPYAFYTITTPNSFRTEQSTNCDSLLKNYSVERNPVGSELPPMQKRANSVERGIPSRYYAPSQQSHSNYSTLTNRIRNTEIPSRNSDVDKFFDDVFDQILTPNEYREISPAQLATTIKGGPSGEGSSKVDLNDSTLNRTIDSAYSHTPSYVPYQPVVMVPADFRMYMAPVNNVGGIPGDEGRSSRLTAMSGFVPAVVQPVIPQNMVMCLPPEGHSSPCNFYQPFAPIDTNSYYKSNMDFNDSTLNESLDESKQSVTMKINSRRQFTTSPTNAIENSRLGQICPTSPKARYVGISSPRDTTDESIQQSLSGIKPNPENLVHRTPKSNIGSVNNDYAQKSAFNLNQPRKTDTTAGIYYTVPQEGEYSSRDYVDINETPFQQSTINNSANVSQSFDQSIDTPRGTRKLYGLYRVPKELYASTTAASNQGYLERGESHSLGNGFNKNESQGSGRNDHSSIYSSYSTVRPIATPSPMKELAKKLKSPTSPTALPPAVGMLNPSIEIVIRKDVFMPNEQIEDDLDANLIFAQIIDDCKTHNIMKLRKHERDVVVHILTTNGIPPQMLEHPKDIPIEVKMGVIQAARSWPIYFSRLFEVNEERYGGSVPRLISVGETGVRVLVADPLNRIEPYRIQDHFEFIDLEYVQSDEEKEMLRLHTKQDLVIDFGTSNSANIKKLIERYMSGETKAKYLVRATSDYVTTEPGFLSFKRGDLIQITKDLSGDSAEKWLKGRIGNEYGKLSSDYVEPCDTPCYGYGGGRDMSMPGEPAYSMYSGDTNPREPGRHTMMEFAMMFFRRPKNVVGSDAMTLGRKKKEWTWKDVADKVKYSDQPINHSLLKIESAHADKMAQEAFLCIMRFMGDMNLKKNQSYTDCLYELLSVCHQYRPLRDEVYCQIIKQTTNNRSPKADNLIRGWRLFSLLTAYFDCSEIMRPYLYKYLSDAAHDDRRPYYAIANLCLDNIMKTFKYGGRKFLLNAAEVEAITMDKPMHKQVYRLPGGHQKHLDTTSVTVAEEIIRELCSEMNILSAEEQQEFCLSCIVGRENVMKLLSNDEYIMDVITELEQRTEEYFLMLKRTVWIHPLRFDNPLYIDMLFFQTVPEYLSGNLNSFGEGKLTAAVLTDVLELAACLHLSDKYNRSQRISQPELAGLVPPKLLHNMNGDQWVKRITNKVLEMGSIECFEAKARFLAILEKWPLFGSTFFYVRQWFKNQPPYDLLLSVNKTGIRLNDVRSQSLAAHIPFDQVKSTDRTTCDGKHCLNIIVGDENETHTLMLETESGGEISRLIGQYLFIGDEYRGTVIQAP